MAQQYLAEGLKGSFPFIADVKNIVVESLPNGKTRTRIPGRFSVCDETNGNGRRYGRRIWEKNLSTGSTLMRTIQENAAFGLLEHPKDGQVTLLSPISHLVTDAKLEKGRDAHGKEIWEVRGEIQIVGTVEGQKLTALIEAGYNPRVSSRGFGSLVRAADGYDDVQEDYVCEGWDVVIKPSFESAVLSPVRETPTDEAAKKAASPSSALTEATPVPTPAATTNNAAPVTLVVQPTTPPITTGSNVKVTLEAERGSQAPTSGAAAPVKTTESSQEKVMNLNEINAQIASFRSTDPSKLSPKRFAEGMSQLGALHQEVENYRAEDTKRGWQAGELHEAIKSIETSWSETQLAPGKTAVKLRENNTKLMHVIKAVAQTGLTFKNKLGESAKSLARQSALLNEVVERGQAWRQHAKALESERDAFRRRFMMASEALQQLGSKYKADITEMGKAHLKGEFKEKLEASPEIQKMLNEATKPKSLVPIRMALEGQITVKNARAVLEGKISLDAAKTASGTPSDAQKVNESQKGAAAPPVAENKKPAASAEGNPKAPVSEGVTILSPKPTDPRDVNESIAMVKRLSPVQG
jgi:hypothetical protein